MELMVPLDSQARCSLYEQIYQYIKEEIKRGRIPAGSRLPSTRILAQNLKVSRSTTQMAYDQLMSEGYIEALPCKGYFVCGIEALIDLKGVEPDLQTEEGDRKKEEEAPYDSSFPEQKAVIDFSPRGIDLESFPFNIWRKLSRSTLVDDNKDMFAGGDPQGEYSLRSVIGSYLHSARGVVCRPEQILIGAGSEYLLMLLSQLLGRDGGIAMENPTYAQAYRVLKGQGHPVYPIEMDRFGMDVEALEASGASVAYVMPSHQYPTGVVMPVKRRQDLLAWAGRRPGRYLIEDDYDSEFRYKGKPVPALQGMDRNGRVIYIGTFSKSIAPAIRVGYMVLPEQLVEVYRERAGFYSSTVSRIDQQILYGFMTEGHYERHLNRMRAIYKGKHDMLLAGLKELEPYFSIKGEYAGLHILMTHKKGAAEACLVKRAEEAGVRVYGMSGCFIHPEHNVYPSTVMLGYANLREEDIERGCGLLKRVWTEEMEMHAY